MLIMLLVSLAQEPTVAETTKPSALAYATSAPLPAPLGEPLPAACPVRWSVGADGAAQAEIDAACPAALADAVRPVLPQWTFAGLSGPATLEATFYLYKPSDPRWTVVGPGDVPTRHWSEAKLKRMEQPKYPEEAKAAGVQGECRLKLYVDEEGTVFHVEPGDCPEVFLHNTTRAAYAAAFYPFKPDGKQASKTAFTMTYKFKLAN